MRNCSNRCSSFFSFWHIIVRVDCYPIFIISNKKHMFNLLFCSSLIGLLPQTRFISGFFLERNSKLIRVMLTSENILLLMILCKEINLRSDSAFVIQTQKFNAFSQLARLMNLGSKWNLYLFSSSAKQINVIVNHLFGLCHCINELFASHWPRVKVSKTHPNKLDAPLKYLNKPIWWA